MVVQHNLSALNTYRMLNITSEKKAKSSEKLSSGYRINRSADDAAGLQISEKMRAQIRGLNQGARNTQDGISFAQVADGAMNEIQDMLHRLTELSVQAANDTNTDADRYAIDEEMQHIKKEIIRIGNTTKFNEIPVFDNNSVQMGLQGVPNDLEIFNATYTAAGDLQTFGGFVFHGERIPWTDIDPNMVTTDADGNEVFVGGSYSYTSPDTDYSFAFYCADGDKLPLITREISIEADKDGIILGEERFAWDKVYDENNQPLSESNLHAGPWTVDYYGAKLSFAVSDPVADIESLAADVDSKKNATVYYDWEGSYGYDFKKEDAVTLVTRDVLDDVTYGNTSYNRVNQESVDAMYDSAKGICYTVRADEEGVWLEKSNGQALPNSKMKWEDDFGIVDWNDGLDIPEYTNGQPANNYVYKNDETKLEFSFDLSDITDREGVIASLNGMKLYQMPEATTYVATIDSTATLPANSGVKGVDFGDNTIALTFHEECTAKRDFGADLDPTKSAEHWIMEDLSALYSSADNKLTLTYNNGGTYELSGSIADLEYHTNDVVYQYMLWVAGEKMNAVANGTADTGINVDSYVAAQNSTEKTLVTTLKSDSGESIELKYQYDYKEMLRNAAIEGKIEAKAVKVEPADVDQNKIDNYYVKTGDKYITTKEYLEQNPGGSIVGQDLYEMSASYPDGFPNIKDTAVDAIYPEVGSQIAAATKIDLTAQTYSKMGGLEVDKAESKVDRPLYNSYLKETPVEPDIWIQHSSQQYDRTGIARFAMHTVSMGLTGTNVRTQESASQAITSISNALKYVSDKRSYYGAIQNRLEHTMNNVKNTSENTTAAESRIRDTDMAKEMVALSVNNILMQAGQSVLTQANQSTQGVLSLLQ